ncbi:SDR family oxidoreductase [Marinomonas epiphytica]
MTRLLQGKCAVVTGAASGIGLASAEAMIEQGAKVVLVDYDEKALGKVVSQLGESAMPLVLDLLDIQACKSLIPSVLELVDHIDIFHANAGLYVGGDLIDAEPDDIDRMMNLNVNVVMKNVRDVIVHMIPRETGDILVTSSLAAHYPTPWEPVYASSKWAIDCFVQTTRRQVFKHGLRLGSVSPGPVETALIADWPKEKLEQAKRNGSLVEAKEIAEILMFMLTRPRNMTIRDVVVMPSQFDL